MKKRSFAGWTRCSRSKPTSRADAFYSIVSSRHMLRKRCVLPEWQYETGKNRGLTRPQQVILVHYGPAKCSGRNLPAPHPAPPDQPAYLAPSACAQRQQHRHVARLAPDRIRLERLSPPPFCDSWQGVRCEPDGLHHVHDRREKSASFSVSFPRQRAVSLRV